MGTGAAILVLALQLPPAGPQPSSLDAILARVSEEAELFRRLAPDVVGVETLVHRGRKAPSRFRLRIGAAATQAPQPSYLVREIVSEYGYSTFREAPEALREFRQVVSVDGRPVMAPEQARLALALNMRSDDDRLRRRMLQQFENYGTVGAATDFGQMLLLFRRRQLEDFGFETAGIGWIGADRCLVLRYSQKQGSNMMRVYTDREMVRLLLVGELWVRQDDYLPLRITMQVALSEQDLPVEHRATIDYYRSAHGLLLPASVHYVKSSGDTLLVENTYRYSDFKMFRVEAGIQFESEPIFPQ